LFPRPASPAASLAAGNVSARAALLEAKVGGTRRGAGATATLHTHTHTHSRAAPLRHITEARNHWFAQFLDIKSNVAFRDY
jgi:hypothetical protein